MHIHTLVYHHTFVDKKMETKVIGKKINKKNIKKI